MKKHNKVGLECNYADCSVRVSSEDERKVHFEFYQTHPM
jgi:hypothetical protein